MSDPLTHEYNEIEACSILGVGLNTLRQQRYRFKKNPDAYCIPFVRRGRNIYYRHDDLMRHIVGDRYNPPNQG